MDHENIENPPKKGRGILSKIVLFIFVLGLGVGLGFYQFGDLNSLGLTDEVATQKGLVLESSIQPSEILSKNFKKQVSSPGHTVSAPTLEYQQYVLATCKFQDKNHRTQEAQSVWNLNDCEMVIDTDKLDETKGFHEAFMAKLSREEFLLLREVAKYSKGIETKELVKYVESDLEQLTGRLAALTKKGLLLLEDGRYFVHIANVNLPTVPETKMKRAIGEIELPEEVTVAEASHSEEEVFECLKRAFGQGFSVTDSKRIFIPVYRVEVRNPDSSVTKSYWNGITGKQVQPKSA